MERATLRRHCMPHGAELQAGGVRFRLWAPGCDHVGLALQSSPDGPVRVVPMTAQAEGMFEHVAPDAAAGTRYRFVLPDGLQVPDPASRHQPEDVHGPSEVIDPAAYVWQSTHWTGRPWHEAVLYELHVGAFTPEGTFRAAIGRLPHLVQLGVTAIELMPVADFPGARNWGYDGALLYAPDATYGRPEDLKALVDAAHAHGLLVLLDVVYNHFGPDGNYLPVYAPTFFTDRHKTPWGAGINYDGQHSKPVREFVVHNALYWIEEYAVDGLRLDAVHAILDDGDVHLLDELATRVHALEPRTHLLLENEENQASRLGGGGARAAQYTAQWNDDVHHVLHVAATGENAGYYADYHGDTVKLARALAEGFAFQGEVMAFRGEARGEPSGRLPPTAFVAFIQNHDQIGNRAFGDRIPSITAPDALRAIVALYLLLPQIPMIFMGEEWASRRPFAFFCDFSGDLAAAVREGRRLEFARFPEFQDEALRARIPDPQGDATYAAAKLDWSELAAPDHAAWFELYRRLLTVRRESVVPLLPGLSEGGRYRVVGDHAAILRWSVPDGSALTLEFNLADRTCAGFSDGADEVLWLQGREAAGIADPWFVRWSLQTGSRAA